MATGWPTIADGAIYGVTRAGDLVATDLASGAERWRLPNGGHWWNPPAVHAGVVYNHVGSEVMAVHARDGRILWRTALDPLRRSVGPVAAGHGPVHVLATRHQRERFQSVSDDAVVTFDAIGGDEVDRLGVPRSPGSIMAPTVSAFTADGAHLYATLTEGAVVALDLESGDLRWRVDVGPEELHPPVLHGDTLYIAGSRRLMALDSATGASQWTLHADEWHIATQPAVDSGIVYVNTTAGFYAFAPDDSTTQR
jgi:outer membrane protein assembly factor BamB